MSTTISRDIFKSELMYLKIGLSPSKKNVCHWLDWKSFKSNEKCFLFHIKSSSRFQDIQVFITTFWSCSKNGLIKKINFKIHDVTTWFTNNCNAHILINISQNKGNQTKKSGQLIEYNKRNIFLQKLCEKWGRETSSRPLFVFTKSLIWCESKWSAA